MKSDDNFPGENHVFYTRARNTGYPNGNCGQSNVTATDHSITATDQSIEIPTWSL